jgi:hypothetical protein
MRLKGKKAIFNYEDTYSLDMTLGPIITEGLKKFRDVLIKQDKSNEACFGVPAVFQLSDEEKLGNEGVITSDEISALRWFAVLEKMIFAFENEEPELPDGVLEMTTSTEVDEYGNYLAELNILNEPLYAKYRMECDKHEKMVEEGLELFAKHYKNLWW